MISCLAFEIARTISRRAPLEDVVLELVELVAHLAEHRERGVDVRVDDLVEQVARALREGRLAELLARLHPLEHRLERRQRDLAERDQVVGADEQVELRGQQPAGRLLERREVEDDEEVVVVRVELRALVARVDVFPVERVEVVVLLEPLAVGEAGIVDVDPAETGGLDDARVVYLGGAGRVEIVGRMGSTEPRARERRQDCGILGAHLSRWLSHWNDLGGVAAADSRSARPQRARCDARARRADDARCDDAALAVPPGRLSAATGRRASHRTCSGVSSWNVEWLMSKSADRHVPRWSRMSPGSAHPGRARHGRTRRSSRS